MTLFTSIGSGLDFLFGKVAGASRGIVTAPEFWRVLGVACASALAGSAPLLAEAFAAQSTTDLGHAMMNGFATGAIGGTVSYLHRRFDDTPPSPPT